MQAETGKDGKEATQRNYTSVGHPAFIGGGAAIQSQRRS